MVKTPKKKIRYIPFSKKYKVTKNALYFFMKNAKILIIHLTKKKGDYNDILL